MLERNLRVYGLYAPLTNALFWAPVFFLYLTERFPVEAVLGLHAFYYSVVVLSEVPSGYLSDRVGRVLTMRLAALAAIASYTLFLMGNESLVAFVLAQTLLAFHFSFRSGTEAAFHFDTLDALGRSLEFGDRAARVQRNRYLAGAVGALVGGGVAVLDLRAAYLLALLAAVAMLGLSFAMREPQQSHPGSRAGFVSQLRQCGGYMREPFLLWLSAYVVLQTVLAHLPYEFYQPYVASVLGESMTDVVRTPFIVGVVTAAIAFVGALAAARSMDLQRRLGVVGLLLVLTAVQTALIVAMAAVVHWAVVAAISFRSVQPAVGNVVVDAAVAPRVPQRLRATYLSIQSLAGRLAYATVLVGLSRLVAGDASASTEALISLLQASAAIALVGFGALVVWPRGREAPV